MLTRVPQVRVEVDSMGGRIAIAAAPPGRAMASARRWIRRLRATPMAIAPVWAGLLTGCAAIRDGNAVAAEAPLHEAIAHADRFSLGLLAAAARLRLGEAGGEIDHALHDLARLGVTDVTRTIAMLAPI
jgi:hypothetical protein